MTLETIQSQYSEIALKLGENPMLCTKKAEEGRHLEYENGVYSLVDTERGRENFRRETEDADEVVCWLVKSLTSGVAMKWELQNRLPHEDSRRQLFAKHIELLNEIDKKWAAEKKADYAETLKKHPFDDAGTDRWNYCAGLKKKGVAQQEAWRLAVEKYPMPNRTD